MKKIMILGASILQLPAIKKAKEMGLEVVVVDMNTEAVGFKEKGIQREEISTIDVEKVLEAARRHKIDGIMTLASDMPMRTVAKVASSLGLVGISEETAMKATNKILMREALAKSKVPIPEFCKVSDENEFYEAIKKLHSKGSRCIVKPADNSGSRGVDLINNYDYSEIMRVYKYSKSYSRSGEVIVEEYMDGPEVSVETLTIDEECHVIQITDKLTTGSPYFVEMGHSQPSCLSEEIQKEITNVAIEANRAIGIDNGPSHTEIKVTSNGPKVVEIGARLGGDNITTHLVPLSTGVDMVKSCIQIALGITPDFQIKQSRAAVIKYIESRKGRILKIDGVENAKRIEGVCDIQFSFKTNDAINEIRSSIDRLGYVIAEGNTIEAALNSCSKAIEELIIEIE